MIYDLFACIEGASVNCRLSSRRLFDEIMMHTGPVVELEVAKQGAIYHGLAELLAKPSPLLSPRGHPRPASTQPQWNDQHLYQNHQVGPIMPQPGPPSQRGPGGPQQSPMTRPQQPPNMRSTSIQNLNQQQAVPPMMGQRQASHPALMNGGGGPGGPRIVTLKVAESYPASLVSFNL